MDPIDYSPFYQAIVEQLTRIADYTETIKNNSNVFTPDFTQFKTDIGALKDRGVNENVGIVVRHVCVPCQSGLDRAVLVNALKQGNQLQNVIKELNSPTDIPGL